MLKRLDQLEAQRQARRVVQQGATTQPVTALGLMRAAQLEPDASQIAMLTSTARQQLWLAHRQFGKSTLASTLGLETACTAPGSLTLLLSRTLRQSSELFRKVKTFYNATMPLPLVSSTALSLELENGSRIISLPGNADTVVGYSAPSLVIIDEAARVPDGLYYAIRPMLAMSRGRLIALSTPWGKRGWFFEAWEGVGDKEQEQLDAAQVQELLASVGMTVQQDEVRAVAQENDFQWVRTQVTARDNARLSPWFLANELRSVPMPIFRSEWLCEFIETTDSVFSYADLEAMYSDRIAPLWGEDAPELPWTSEGCLPLFAEDAA